MKKFFEKIGLLRKFQTELKINKKDFLRAIDSEIESPLSIFKFWSTKLIGKVNSSEFWFMFRLTYRDVNLTYQNFMKVKNIIVEKSQDEITIRTEYKIINNFHLAILSFLSLFLIPAFVISFILAIKFTVERDNYNMFIFPVMLFIMLYFIVIYPIRSGYKNYSQMRKYIIELYKNVEYQNLNK